MLLKQVLSDGALKTQEKIDKLDEYISANGDKVAEMIFKAGQEGGKEVNEYYKTLHRMLVDLRKGQEGKLEYERGRKVDFHSPQIQRALSVILNLVMEALKVAQVEEEKVGVFKHTLTESLIGIEERLNRLSLSEEVL